MAVRRQRCARSAPSAIWGSMSSDGSPPWRARVFAEMPSIWYGRMAMWRSRHQSRRRRRWRPISMHGECALGSSQPAGQRRSTFLRGRGADVQKFLHDVDHDRAATVVEMDTIDMEGPTVHLSNRVAVLAK